jgi:hypothetical protein
MSRFANIDGPVTFLLYNLEYYFFSKVDLELFLEFKNSFGKCHSVCPKNP